jgi:hypothetical protein
MNTNTEPLNNKIIDINNMCEQITFLNLGPIPEFDTSSSSTSHVEEIIADVSMISLREAHDDLLFALKHTQEPNALYSYEDEAADNHKIPRKRVKTFHEHPIPEPMEIINSAEKWMYSCCPNCVLTDGQNPSQYCRRAYPDRVIERYSDDSDEERELDEYDPHRVFKTDTTIADVDQEDEEDVDDLDEYYNEIWILEQEAKRRYPRRRRPEGLEEIAIRLFEDEPEQEVIMPVPPMPVLQRQNTQFTINGVHVYNGNPNGSRFFDEDLL